jgi:AraC-like DNA-binding protein
LRTTVFDLDAVETGVYCGEEMKNMAEYSYIFNKGFQMTGVAVSVFQDDQMLYPEKPDDFHAVRDNSAFRHKLVRMTDERKVPLIYLDEHKVIVAAVRQDGCYYFFGPVSSEHLNRVELHRYYFDMNMRKGMEKEIPYFPFSRFLAYLELMVFEITGRKFTDEQIINGNLLQSGIEEEKTSEEISIGQISDAEESAHHTYMEERRLLDCVREGRVEEALRMNARMDSEIGVMSKNETEQVRKLVTVAIALSVRAAIEGGLTPSEAYRMSDLYLQKLDECKTLTELLAARNRAVRDIATRVHECQMRKRKSSYVERCCDYVNRNYRNKIYLSDIASELGISASYLSRLFAGEMGVKLQDYIVQVRVERAANLLTYSEESISKISDYVNFPSQSYFGRVFRKYKNMTPREYRERYKPKEF